MARVFIGLGSNVRPMRNIPRAVALLRDLLSVEKISTFYRTAPVGPVPRGTSAFVNGAVLGRTRYGARGLKSRLRKIETLLGRRWTADRYAPRPIDLDLLLYGDLVLSGEMTVPDPEIERRPYLAAILFELAPDLVLPDSGRRIADIATGLASESKGMKPLPGLVYLSRSC